VDLVYDIDLFSGSGRGIYDLVPYGAYIVDTVVGGSVYLKYIHTVAGQYLQAYFAFVARFSVMRLQAVDCTGKYMGHCGLACPPGTAEKISMGDPSRAYTVSERFYHVLLLDHVLELSRPPFSVQSNVGHHQQPFFRTSL